VDELFASGRIVELILAFIVLEAAALLAWRARTGRGLAWIDVAANLLAGAFLLLAMRLTMAGLPWFWVAPCLLAALAAHVADLSRRLRS
jgi:hypothetical protein